MKIRLPRDLRGTGFSVLAPFDINSFDIDLIVPAIFFAVLSEGHTRAHPKANDPQKLDEYVAALSRHSAVDGFDSDDGRRLLGKLVRTALVITSAVGQARTGEQIAAVVPYTLLAHKPGFPRESSRLRAVDTYVYKILLQLLGSSDILKRFFMEAFGHGVVINPMPHLGGSHDGSPVDTLTRLHIAFMDCFQSTAAVEKRRERRFVDPLSALSREFALDLYHYVLTYHKHMPPQELTRNFTALLNFQLFIYSRKLIHALADLVGTPDVVPLAMRSPHVPSPPEIYVDFTPRNSELSSEMSAACVRRDVEAHHRFMYASLLIRQLDAYVHAIRRRAGESSKKTDSSDSEELQRLLLLRTDRNYMTDLNASARIDEDRVRRENIDDDGDVSESLSGASDALATASDDLDRVVLLLLESQTRAMFQSLMKWYRATAGFGKPYGLLTGRLRGRSSWRYQPSDALLSVLVQLAVARIGQLSGAPQAIRVHQLLEFLEQRFGLIVSRPPSSYAGATYVAAAQENLQSMLSRLRQMGTFRDLSDDFTVQKLEVPYLEHAS